MDSPADSNRQIVIYIGSIDNINTAEYMWCVSLDSKKKKRGKKVHKTTWNKRTATALDQRSRFNTPPTTKGRGAEAGQGNSGVEIKVTDGINATALG